ncbi:unnamed protein product [Discula destructiva]
MPFQPVALYGLEVPPGDFLIPVTKAGTVNIRLTMAAIDPTEDVEDDGQPPRRPRSTLKLIKQDYDNMGDSDDDDDDDSESEMLRDLLMNGDDSDEGDDEETNGGPSDPTRSKKALKAARLQELLDATNDDDDEDSDEEMADDEPQTKNGKKALANGKAKGKGKEKAIVAKDEEEEDDDEEDESDDEEDDDMQGLNLKQYTICTLDTEAHYQQPIDLVVGEGEKAFFVNTGTHTVYITGNYIIDEDAHSHSDDEDSDDDDYDLPPGMEDLIGDESEDDELDNITGTGRVEEVDTDEEEPPKLIEVKKGKNKRPATEEAEGLDDLIAKEEPKLSKKQAKKLKSNEGKAVAAEKDTPKSEKKVQFAKNLEQGPTPTASPAEKAKQGDKGDKAAAKKPTVRVEKGVQIDDRKIGTGRTAKPGDKVGMRYIGKLENGKVFDSNKKGPPFSFKLGKGEVIEGWDIGVKGMGIGGERRLTIPASKAYGSKSMGGIPANSTLIFDIKLLEIK